MAIAALREFEASVNLTCSVPFDASSTWDEIAGAFAAAPAVFALFPESPAQPYLSRTTNLRRRLARLLSPPQAGSRRLNLRALTRRIEYQRVGSSFEGQWLLYQLNKAHFPRAYRERLRMKPPVLLKVNLRNRFPRCYPTRRLARDGSLYYGPFPSRAEADRFAGEFLDLFKIRRCVEDLTPDPSHPGCIYSQMKMCLAPCFAGCTDDEYQRELGEVVRFLDSEGKSVVRALEAERASASESLAFEQAASAHRRLEKVEGVLRRKPGLAGNLSRLHAVMVLRGAEPKGVTLFRIAAGEIRGPAALDLDERAATPVPLDQRIHAALDPLAAPASAVEPEPARALKAPPWEHLSLLARWYYSSFREGELVLLPANQEIPHARLVRLCRRMVEAKPGSAPA